MALEASNSKSAADNETKILALEASNSKRAADNKTKILALEASNSKRAADIETLESSLIKSNELKEYSLFGNVFLIVIYIGSIVCCIIKNKLIQKEIKE